jgi:hypothetical protein
MNNVRNPVILVIIIIEQKAQTEFTQIYRHEDVNWSSRIK